MSRKRSIDVARIYDAPPPDGRFCVLVDRIWPRGVKKTDVQIDEWMKDLAPSTELRKWFNHDPARWDQFRSRYFSELAPQKELIRTLLEKSKGKSILLLFSARDTEHNNAVALKEYLLKQSPK